MKLLFEFIEIYSFQVSTVEMIQRNKYISSTSTARPRSSIAVAQLNPNVKTVALAVTWAPGIQEFSNIPVLILSPTLTLTWNKLYGYSEHIENLGIHFDAIVWHYIEV